MKRIIKGDDVIVISGRYKGKRGQVLRLTEDGRAYVNDVNLVKKHKKGNPNKNEKGGIVQQEAPIHLSNLALYNPTTKKADRVGFRTLEDGRKVRFFKSSQEVVDIG
ncbi:MAG: 50S ribosomal protein L24 [Gammaproteobacteria bacterium]|nr:50S ribosomal protein L24 [Gammaproteobacteria bacterium]MCY4226439.1 50S ribosomal protein L24 [Gammaproteobacteria bacterium]MCY4314357.1 50S ribosomal protein L24 [Gammaproteobacteria bacterium]